MAKLMSLIEAPAVRGKGVPESPHRSVTQYFMTDGTILAENDPCLRDGLIDIMREMTTFIENPDTVKTLDNNVIVANWKRRLEDLVPQRW